mgnify:CR=1 FL=1
MGRLPQARDMTDSNQMSVFSLMKARMQMLGERQDITLDVSRRIYEAAR